MPNQASLQMPNAAPGYAREAPQWSSLGIVRPELAARMTEDEIVKQILEKKQEAKRGRQDEDRKWDFYQASYDLAIRNGAKKQWQSDLVVPDVANVIRKFTSTVRSGLFGSSQWMRLIPYEHAYPDGFLRALQGWVKYVMERGGFREEYLKGAAQAALLGTSALLVSIDDYIRTTPRLAQVPVFTNPQDIMMAQMQGIPTVKQVIETQPIPASQLKYRWRDIRQLYPDPYASGPHDWTYIVDESDVDEEVLEERAMAGVYDSIDDIGEPFSEGANRSLNSYEQRRLLNPLSTTRRRHRVDEYRGNLYGQNGELVAKNWIVTVVNERAIVRIGPNPLWSGRPSYVWIRPIPQDDDIWGKSMVEFEAEVQEEKSILLNLAIESVHYAVMSIFLHDDAKSNEPLTLDTVYPGMVLHGSEEFLRRIQFGDSSNVVWPVYSQLTNLGDRDTGINEFVDGTPTSRGRPSAAESKIKASAGSEYLKNILEGLEETSVVPSVELTYEHLLQFGDDLSDPTLQQVLEGLGGPPAIADLMSRIALLSHPFKVKAQGVSFGADREEWLAKMPQLMQVLMQFGLAQAAPNVMMRAAYIWLEALGIDPTTLALAADPESQMMMLMGMAQAASMPGGSLPSSEATQGVGNPNPLAGAPPAPSPMMQ